jgi:hypothetical protein
MIRITITQAAYEAISATLPLGSVAVEPEANERVVPGTSWKNRGERAVWLEAEVVNRLGAMRRPGESYSQVILRIARQEGACGP